MKEVDIQTDIVNYLQVLENLGMITFQRNNTVGIYDVRKRTFRKLPKGTKRGYPDITVFTDNRTIGLEVKTSKGIQSKYQKWWEYRLKKHHKEYYIVRSVEDVERVIY